MADENFIREQREAILTRSRDESERFRYENRLADILKEDAPGQWVALKRWLRDSVEQLSLPEVIYEDGPGLERCSILYSIHGNRRNTTINFIPTKTPHISVQGTARDFAFDGVVEGGSVRWIESDSKRRESFDVECIGKRILISATR